MAGDQNSAPSDKDEFRNHIATVDEKGERVWIYPRKPHGRFTRLRTFVSWLLFAVLFGGPFFRVNGRPLVLLNILERKFILFGIGFWPQDFHLFALSFLALVVFILLFTIVYGRLFCGWLCPQTVFLEMLFRKIEYWLEGDSHKQRELDKAPWTFRKFRIKTLKHGIFYALSFLIGNTFLAYIIGSDELLRIITAPALEHWEGLLAMLVFSCVFYWVFARFREQACVMVCPYGRLQGVMLDRDSIVVSYDFQRGEPRSHPRTAVATRPQGDCVDCGLCVEVCPTGIDIRDGTQLECVNCTACIDACDSVMAKHKRPSGLVRYASYNEIAEGRKATFNNRMAGYTFVLILLTTFIAFLMWNRSPVEATILRVPGSLFQRTSDGRIQNVYNVKIINKSFQDRHIRFYLRNHPDDSLKVATGSPLKLPADSLVESVLFVRLPEDALTLPNETVLIEVYDNKDLMDVYQTSFKTPL